MTDFKVIPLSDILPDPNQPRKFYDEMAMAELSQSIKEKGVLQPILLRPSSNGYQIVCGERRFRGSTTAGLTEIPAVIRELSDEEALELQIIENLQRKDVHPMEEAVAFKSLMEGKQWTIQEVATRVGKKDFYIRQRLKLNDLAPEWQQLFYKNGFTLTEALQICMLPAKAQLDFYTNEISTNGGISHFTFNEYRLGQYKGDLHKATFDLADPTLNRQMGPCTTCQFNTAVSLLFPDHAHSPRCMNVPCFKTKTDVFFNRELDKAKEDPSIIFISTAYSSDNKLVEQLRKEGHVVLSQYNDYTAIDAPEKPDWEEYKTENFFEEEGHNLADVREAFEKELSDYEKEKLSFDKKISSSKYKLAFEVAGYHIGKYCYIEIKKNAEQKTSKAAVEAGTAEADDIDTEINRLQEREKRSKEIDGEKIHKEIVDALKKDASYTAVEMPNGKSERVLIIFLLFEQLRYESKSETLKKLNLKDPAWLGTAEERKKWFGSLSEISNKQFSFLLRRVILDNYSGHLPQNTGGTAVRILAESLGSIAIDQIELNYSPAALKRQQRVNERIADLNTKKEELQAAAKPAAPTKNKSSKKQIQ